MLIQVAPINSVSPSISLLKYRHKYRNKYNYKYKYRYKYNQHLSTLCPQASVGSSQGGLASHAWPSGHTCLYSPQLTNLFVCLFISLCICLSFYLFVCLFVCLLVCLSVGRFVCLAKWLFDYFFACLSVCLFAWLSVCLSYIDHTNLLLAPQGALAGLTF